MLRFRAYDVSSHKHAGEIMEPIDTIRTAEYLFKASPETVYEWFKVWPKRTPGTGFFFGNDVPEEIEQKLLTRNDEIVDLSLASWGTQRNTISTLYQRHCSRSVVIDWPPRPSTYPYAILAAVLANVNLELFFRSQKLESTGIPAEDFEWLIEHSDKQGFFGLMHRNIGLGIGLLHRCTAKEGAYGRIDDDRWLTAVAMLGSNEALHVPNRDDHDGPDLQHYDIHESFVKASTISPKTITAAAVFGRLFDYLPTAATDGAYVDTKLLIAAVLAWNVEIPEIEDGILSTDRLFDALSPSERVQFHLLRHYGSISDLDPDDPIRVCRLAAYSKNPVNGGKSLSTKGHGKGLNIESYERYAERDGPAFMYANSYNAHIWCDKVASKPFNWGETTYKYQLPDDGRGVIWNREKCVEDAAKKSHEDDAENSAGPEDDLKSKTFIAVEKLQKDATETHRLLSAQIGSLKKWLIWGGIIVVGVLLLKQ